MGKAVVRREATGLLRPPLPKPYASKELVKTFGLRKVGLSHEQTPGARRRGSA